MNEWLFLVFFILINEDRASSLSEDKFHTYHSIHVINNLTDVEISWFDLKSNVKFRIHLYEAHINLINLLYAILAPSDVSKWSFKFKSMIFGDQHASKIC